MSVATRAIMATHLMDEEPFDVRQLAWRERARLGIARMTDASARTRLAVMEGIPLRSLRFMQQKIPPSRG
jgi:hypothetical protein